MGSLPTPAARTAPARAYERRLVRAALLLHDVGHGPFSHACEAVLGVRHEERTREILALPAMREGIEALDVDPADVLGLILGDPGTAYPALRELVSGPNLDADRMDYLLRDAYFTGVVERSLRCRSTRGVAAPLRTRRRSRGRHRFTRRRRARVVRRGALHDVRLGLFPSHDAPLRAHLTRRAARTLARSTRARSTIDEFLRWDDFRVLNELREVESEAARALRERIRIYALRGGVQCRSAICVPTRRARAPCVNVSAQMRCGPTNSRRSCTACRSWRPRRSHTVWVGTPSGLVDAREVSDLINKLSGKAYWRKLFVRRDRADVREARALCAEIIAGFR